MQLLRVMNTRLHRELGTRIRVADRWLSRLRGMLARPAPRPGEGLMLTPCSSVHMYGMRYSLDVAFLDMEGKVVGMYHSLGPGARTRWHRNATYALELPSGTLEESGTSVGDLLIWSASPGAPDRHAPMEAAS
jgi:uncharacterized protein